MSAQYCRYCAHMICGDFNYCEAKQKFFSDAQIKRTNSCREFELNPMDALQENERGYRERREKPPDESAGEQMTIDI